MIKLFAPIASITTLEIMPNIQTDETMFELILKLLVAIGGLLPQILAIYQKQKQKKQNKKTN